jgi:DNA-binding response OmpR family regulator
MSKKADSARTIVLVEDERALSTALVTELGDEGFSVIPAYDGVAGFKAIAKHRPNLVLLDINMPKRNGLQVLEDLREDAQLRKIPVMMLTVQGDFKSASDAEQYGVKDYIIKTDQTLADVARKVKHFFETTEKETEAPGGVSS